MSTPRETWHFDTRHVGRRVLVFDSVGSTNDVAADLAGDRANDGTVVVADFQTAGRGQYGRVWESRPGASLLASVLLFPPPGLNRPVILTACAAVAVAEAVRDLSGAESRIKWPNDLLVDGKKVCGILIEQRRGTVAGIGLNLNQTAADFAAAGLPNATSLAALGGSPVDHRAAVEALVRRLDAAYAGGTADLEAEWRRRVGLVGRDVVVELTDGTTAGGRLTDLAFAGLELEAGGGAFRVFPPESVRHLLG